MENETVILITLVGYKLFLIAIGLWASRKTQSNEDFFLGDRQLGPYVAAVSYSASACSAWTLLGLSGAAFVIGISVLWLVLGALAGMMVAWLYLAKPVQTASREQSLLTLTDLAALDIDGKSREHLTRSIAFVILFSFVFYIAAQFQGAGTAFSGAFGLPSTEAILTGALIVMIYTWLGGFWAVSLTDAIQGTVMLFASALLPIATLLELGGFTEFWSSYQQVASPAQLSLTGNAAGLAIIGVVVGGLSTGISTFGQPHLIIRFMALRDETARRQATAITAVWYVIVWFGMAFLGLAGALLVPELANTEQVFFALADSVLPTLLAGLLVAAVISAIMSTADSQLLVSASVLSHDLGFGKHYPNRQLLISRIAVAAVVGISTLIALFLPAQIFARVLFAWVALGAAFGPMVIARVAGWQLASHQWLIGIWLGFGSAIGLSLLPNAPGDIAERLLPFVLHLGFLALVRKR